MLLFWLLSGMPPASVQNHVACGKGTVLVYSSTGMFEALLSWASTVLAGGIRVRTFWRGGRVYFAGPQSIVYARYPAKKTMGGLVETVGWRWYFSFFGISTVGKVDGLLHYYTMTIPSSSSSSSSRSSGSVGGEILMWSVEYGFDIFYNNSDSA